MKITVDKALEILQIELRHQEDQSTEDLDAAITLGLEAILEHHNRNNRKGQTIAILLPHESP